MGGGVIAKHTTLLDACFSNVPMFGKEQREYSSKHLLLRKESESHWFGQPRLIGNPWRDSVCILLHFSDDKSTRGKSIFFLHCRCGLLNSTISWKHVPVDTKWLQNDIALLVTNFTAVNSPVSGAKTVFNFLQNVIVATVYYIVCCMYHGNSEMKYPACGAERLMLAFKMSVPPTLNPSLNLKLIMLTKANVRLKCICLVTEQTLSE